MQFNKDWSFKTFLYKNFGVTITREQERKALWGYLNKLNNEL